MPFCQLFRFIVRYRVIALIYIMKNFLKTLMALITFGSLSACGQSGDKPYESVDPQQFAEKIAADSTAYILDVRTPQEFAEGHIQGAHNLDWLNRKAFQEGAPSIPKADTVYVYCRSGRRSAEAASYLSKLGYKVVDLDGGWLSWSNARR